MSTRVLHYVGGQQCLERPITLWNNLSLIESSGRLVIKFQILLLGAVFVLGHWCRNHTSEAV